MERRVANGGYEGSQMVDESVEVNVDDHVLNVLVELDEAGATRRRVVTGEGATEDALQRPEQVDVRVRPLESVSLSRFHLVPDDSVRVGRDRLLMLWHLEAGLVAQKVRDSVELNRARDLGCSLHDRVMSSLNGSVNHLLVVHVGPLQVRINRYLVCLLSELLLLGLQDHVIIDSSTSHTVEDDCAADGSTELEHDLQVVVILGSD